MVKKAVIITVLVAALCFTGYFIFMFLLNRFTFTTSSSNKSTIKSDVVDPNTIVIRDFYFSPNTLTIKPGTKVIWINKDSIVHSIKSDLFKSPGLNQNDKYEFTFKLVGEHSIGCGLHPAEVGKIIIK